MLRQFLWIALCYLGFGFNNASANERVGATNPRSVTTQLLNRKIGFAIVPLPNGLMDRAFDDLLHQEISPSEQQANVFYVDRGSFKCKATQHSRITRSWSRTPKPVRDHLGAYNDWLWELLNPLTTVEPLQHVSPWTDVRLYGPGEWGAGGWHPDDLIWLRSILSLGPSTRYRDPQTGQAKSVPPRHVLFFTGLDRQKKLKIPATVHDGPRRRPYLLRLRRTVLVRDFKSTVQ